MPGTILFGGSGFLGPIILRLYPDIISVGRTPPPPEVMNRHIPLESLDDLSPLDRVDFDKVIFLIGNSNHHEINTRVTMGLDYNVIPLKKTLAYMEKRKLKKFIAFTTILLYDASKLRLPTDESQETNPYINDYVFSKYLAEEVTRFYGPKVPIINIRFSNVYGPTRLIRPDLVPTLIHDVLTKEHAEVWSGKPERDFIFAEDSAEAIVKLLDTDYTGPLNLGTGEMHSVSEIARIVERISGKKVKVLDKPVNGPMKFVTDISLLQMLTGWKPRHTLEEGLKKTYEMMKDDLANIPERKR
jgi:nucleoside-diphosphate-sugar epimerase